MEIKKIIDVAVIFIGLYMVVKFSGGKLLIPPVVSGVALVLIGIRGFIEN